METSGLSRRARPKPRVVPVLPLAALTLSLCGAQGLSAADPSAASPAAGVAGVFDVRAFGARGDGRSVDTPAINAAIEAANAAGGGTVRFPAGTYLSASVHLESHVGLYLEHGAVLEAADPSVAKYDDPEPNVWGDEHHYQDFGRSHWHNSLIWGEGLEDVSITGPGLIYGKGLIRSEPKAARGTANKAIALRDCRHVTLRDVSIRHGGWFAILATGVDDLTIDDVKIDTNRDGIDVDACRNVRIANSHVNSPYDDGICLKSSYGLGRARATENVTVTNCAVTGYDEGSLLDGTYRREVEYGHGPTGRIKFGTESNGGFRNITISNCVLEYGRGLAIESVDGGSIEDVSISNVTMRDVVNAPIFVRLGRRMRGPEGVPIGVVRRVSISDVVASGVAADQGVLISGIPEHPIEDLRLSNIRIAYAGGGRPEDAALEPEEEEAEYPEPYRFGRLPAWAFFLRHVSGVDLSQVDVSHDTPDMRPGLVLRDARRVRLDGVRVQRDPGVAGFVLRHVEDFVLRGCPGFPDQSRESVDELSF